VKAAKFNYILARSIEEAVQSLDKGGGEAVIIAGGQTLMPLLAMRLARPATVIDINGITALSGIEAGEHEVVIKACTRQAMALASPLVQTHLPLLAKAIARVGHQQTRNRGTVGGSLAHADPASEIPLAALAMDARISLRSVAGVRQVALTDYFLGPMMTARADDELMLSVHFSRQPSQARIGTGFHEVSERRGDFAVVAAAAQVQLDANGVCTTAALAVGGVDGVPRRISGLEAQLLGSRIDQDSIRATLPEIANAITPGDDQHASAAYRRRVAGVLAERALLEAIAEVAQ
jgi:CO/xanthine dehydrogenase FAD-binding subunit